MTKEEKQQIMARYHALPEPIKNHIAVERAFHIIDVFEQIVNDKITVNLDDVLLQIIAEAYSILEDILNLIEIAKI